MPMLTLMRAMRARSVLLSHPRPPFLGALCSFCSLLLGKTKMVKHRTHMTSSSAFFAFVQLGSLSAYLTGVAAHAVSLPPAASLARAAAWAATARRALNVLAAERAPVEEAALPWARSAPARGTLLQPRYGKGSGEAHGITVSLLCVRSGEPCSNQNSTKRTLNID